MKSNAIFAGILFLLVFTGCSSPHYLPAAKNAGVNTYGAHIKINFKNSRTRYSGEFIALDSQNFYILNREASSAVLSCKAYPRDQIQKYYVEVAKPVQYGWTIPAYTLITVIGHGFFATLTFPANLIITIIVTASGENAYKFKSHKIPVEELNKFARFPQGIPPGVELHQIRH